MKKSTRAMIIVLLAIANAILGLASMTWLTAMVFIILGIPTNVSLIDNLPIVVNLAIAVVSVFGFLEVYWQAIVQIRKFSKA